MPSFAYPIVAGALVLIIVRPQLGRFRMQPAVTGVIAAVSLLAVGAMTPSQVGTALSELWRPFLTIACIMIITEVANRLGVLDWLSGLIEERTSSTSSLFAAVYVLAALVATALSNDGSILLVTPLVVALVRRRFPEDDGTLMVPFVFAVFMAAGIAPLPVANPINLVVADHAGIQFNAYALQMFPPALACWVISFAILRFMFRKALRSKLPDVKRELPRINRAQLANVIVIAMILVAYVIVSYLRGPVWVVAASGALVSVWVAVRLGDRHPGRILAFGVSWTTLVFVGSMVMLAIALRNAGLTDILVGAFADEDPLTIGTVAALGSSVLNNHPMSYMNMLALDELGAGSPAYLAALIGGDLGPRLLPIGSLAGLLWLEALYRRSVHISLWQFVRVGVPIAIPSLLISLAVLGLLG